MKKIVGLSLVLMMVIGMMSVGTFAYLTDAEASSGNRPLAGTLDLKTNDVDGVSQTLYATSMSPGATVGSSTIALKNNGTTNGAAMDIVFTYVESDGSTNTTPKTADETAAIMEVTALNYGGSSLLSSVNDVNSNGYKDVYDLKNSNLTGLSGITASATRNFDISVRSRSETGNDFQSDGIAVTMTFTLKH